MPAIFADVYRGRRVLVTGHTGFKGSWLVLWLLQLGSEVAGFSIDVPTTPSNFDLLGLEKRIRHFQGDIRDIQRLAEVIDEFKPEIIFHLAAQALVRQSYDDPRTTFETNVMGMVNLLDCIRSRHWINVAVLITSDKAYRNDEWCWGYRENDPLGGHDPYSSSKSCADLIASSYFNSFLKNSDTKIAITRAGNVIGGGDWAADRIVPDCIRAWSSSKVVDIRSPNATRPWQHVLEPLSGYLWLGAELDRGLPGVNGEAFNFGPVAQVNQTVGELIEEMSRRWTKAMWKSASDHKLAGYEANLLKLSCDKALFHLKWSAVMKFSETVELTIDWYRTWYEAELDIYEYSRVQIEKYVAFARERGAAWAEYG